MKANKIYLDRLRSNNIYFPRLKYTNRGDDKYQNLNNALDQTIDLFFKSKPIPVSE